MSGSTESALETELAPQRPRASLPVRLGVVAAGLAAAGVMVMLGLWQMQVFTDEGQRSAEAIRQLPPLALAEAAPAGREPRGALGRRVSFTGQYDAAHQVLVATDGGAPYRVVTALRQDDGDVVAVVRGTVEAPRLPPVPSGRVSGVGVLLPAELGDDTSALPAGQLGSVRLQRLVQTWPQPLTPAFVTLDADGARAQGLRPAVAALPESQHANSRSAGYALQWWAFAAFALVATGVGVRTLSQPAPEPDVESESV